MIAMLPGAFSLLADQFENYAWFPEQASTFAETNDWLYGVITFICVLFFVPIAGFLFYCALRYHKPKGGKAESQVAHHTMLELFWSIAPSFVLVGMFYLGARAYLDIRTVPEGSYEVGVQAFKWGWTMDYGRGTYHPELHLVVNEPTKLTMKSSDVIHSLYIPAFRAKKDIVPGRYNYMWFQPTVASKKVSDAELEKARTWTKESGEAWDYEKWQFTENGYRFYDLYCTEYCGKNHSEMQTVVVVHQTQEELDAWIKEVSARDPDKMDPAPYGKLLYERRGCKGCHSVDGTKMSGPSYKDAYGTVRKLQSGAEVLVDENYVRESILNPKAKIAEGYPPVMPSFKGQLSDDDIYCLIEFIKTLSANTPQDAAAGSSESSDEQPAE
ncbi:MAG: cytochrome c oxidase subunit II [Pirellulaceae bacterium]|nr:cytochrome c oxidase subunit II [Pirellulaceae bacterium]